MFLCFGTFANILKKCAIPKLSNRVLVSTLVGTIDPNNRYGDKNNDTAVSRLMNCDRNFPTVEVEATNGPVRTVDGSQTNIIALARSKRPLDVEQAFDPVIALLDEDKKITLYLDRFFAGGLIGVHPNDNTATIWLAAEDLVRVIEDHGNPVEWIDI